MLIESFDPSNEFNTNRIIYVNAPYKLSYFPNKRWAALPSDMILQSMFCSFNSSGFFNALFKGYSYARPDYRLQIELIKLQQNYISTKGTAEVALIANLYSKDNAIIGVRTFISKKLINKKSSYVGVAAINMAVHELTQEVLKWCIQRIA